MPWLTEHHPDLVPRYERTYTRSYAPKADRGRVNERVRAMVREGSPGARPAAGSFRYERRHETAPVPSQPELW
jgi:hypothetical protein